MSSRGLCRSIAALGLASLLSLAAGCGWSHGPVRDNSRFVTAALTRGHVAVFSFADVAYRPAQGVAAFPDGGQARYVRDENVIGTYDLETGVTKILRAEENDDYHHDSGHYTIVAAVDGAVLLSQGGQLRGPFAMELRWWLADLDSGEMLRLQLAGELAERGRSTGEVRLIDGNGTLLLTCPPLGAEADRKRDGAAAGPELWLRRRSGEYVLVTRRGQVEAVEPSRIVIFVPDPRQLYEFDVASGATRTLARYTPPPYEQVTRGVSPTNSGAALSLSRRADDGSWNFTALPLTHDAVRDAPR